MSVGRTKPTEAMVGHKFGRWLVLGAQGKRVECVCDCGTKRIVTAHPIRTGQSLSCGCLHRELQKQSRLGVSCDRSPEYLAWRAMRFRCFNPNSPEWRNYGARGITVCDEWRSDFMAFYNHIGPRPGPVYSLDRIDNDGSYQPGNVRWATASEQQRNKRQKQVFRGRQLRPGECQNGHILADVGFRISPSTGKPVCRECERRRTTEYRQRKRTNKDSL